LGRNREDGTRLAERIREQQHIDRLFASEIVDMKLNEKSASTLNHFLGNLSLCEKKLLAKKKQRALDELETIILKLMKTTRNEKTIEHLHELQKMLRNPLPHHQLDWDEVASRWLDLIRPVWFERLSGKRSKPLLLSDIRKDLLERPE